MEEHIQTLSQVIYSLRDLFKTKDRLDGIDDWDIFLGCIIALAGIKSDLKNQAALQQEAEIPLEG